MAPAGPSGLPSRKRASDDGRLDGGLDGMPDYGLDQRHDGVHQGKCGSDCGHSTRAAVPSVAKAARLSVGDATSARTATATATAAAGRAAQDAVKYGRVKVYAVRPASRPGDGGEVLGCASLGCFAEAYRRGRRVIDPRFASLDRLLETLGFDAGVVLWVRIHGEGDIQRVACDGDLRFALRRAVRAGDSGVVMVVGEQRGAAVDWERVSWNAA